jgi:hypothetical protein
VYHQQLQYKVVIEMGFDGKHAEYFHNKEQFNQAGDLVDKLLDVIEDENLMMEVNMEVKRLHEEKLAAAAAVATETASGGPSPSPTPPSPEKEMTPEMEKNQLIRETLHMYKRTKCRHCHENPATIVLLPCSHLSLCFQCSNLSHLRHCPESGCNVVIDRHIMTYRV